MHFVFRWILKKRWLDVFKIIIMAKRFTSYLLSYENNYYKDDSTLSYLESVSISPLFVLDSAASGISSK